MPPLLNDDDNVANFNGNVANFNDTVANYNGNAANYNDHVVNYNGNAANDNDNGAKYNGNALSYNGNGAIYNDSRELRRQRGEAHPPSPCYHAPLPTKQQPPTIAHHCVRLGRAHKVINLQVPLWVTDGRVLPPLCNVGFLVDI